MIAQQGVQYWTGEVPYYDDFGFRIANEFIDGRTRTGQWAYMTPFAHRQHGVGLGTGKGQRYRRDGEKWVKIEG